MAFRLPWREAALTWAAFGVLGGAAYLGYEACSRWRNPTPADRPRPGTLLHGLLAWPLMLPEAVEYLLADLGVLAAPAPPPGEEADASTFTSGDQRGD
jgi:hypothetical protein